MAQARCRRHKKTDGLGGPSVFREGAFCGACAPKKPASDSVRVVVTAAIGFAAALVMRMGVALAVCMGMCVGMVVCVVVITAVVLAAAFFVRV